MKKYTTISQRIGFSSTGWKLVWDALKAALKDRDLMKELEQAMLYRKPTSEKTEINI